MIEKNETISLSRWPSLIFSQVKNLRYLYLFLFTTSTFFIGAAIVIHLIKNISFGILTRDIVAITDVPVYTGFLSQLSILTWACATTSALFSYLVISKKTDSVAKLFFLSATLLSLLLCLDDAFLFHEIIFPHFGIPEKVVYLSYVFFIISFLIKFYKFILKTEFVILGTSLAFFAISVLFDITHGMGIDDYILEDGAKFIGNLFWFAYFLRTGVLIISNDTKSNNS